MATINRSAKTGKIVTKAKAKRSPKTTVTETITGYERHRKEVIEFIKSVAASKMLHSFVPQAQRLLIKIK